MVLGSGACDRGFSNETRVAGTKGHEDSDVTDGSDGRLCAAFFVLSTAVLLPVGRGNVCDRLGETRGFSKGVAPPFSGLFNHVFAIGGGRRVR
jgi:hypothetical protein